MLTSKNGKRGVFAGRIDALYSLDRHFLSLPFAALCVSASILGGGAFSFLPFLPLALMLVVAIAAGRLAQAYRQRAADDDPRFWARRYTLMSTIAGASWGVGVFFWFVPGSFAAQAYLCLAFMGMTATEFIARSAYRPSYLAHAGASLGPLIAVLLIQGEPYSGMTALLVFCFGAALAGYCGGMAKLLDESNRLRLTNTELVKKLLAEKQQAGGAAPAPTAAETQTAIDAAAFAALEKTVGSATLIEILKSYIETAEQLCTALQAASGDANWNEAARLAQDIAGSASGLGLMAMTAAARGFAQATRQGAGAHALRNDAQLIVTEHERVRRELAKMYPDLVA